MPSSCVWDDGIYKYTPVREFIGVHGGRTLSERDDSLVDDSVDHSDSTTQLGTEPANTDSFVTRCVPGSIVGGSIRVHCVPISRRSSVAALLIFRDGALRPLLRTQKALIIVSSNVVNHFGRLICKSQLQGLTRVAGSLDPNRQIHDRAADTVL